MLRRILWGWECTSNWTIFNDIFKVTIPVPVNLDINQYKHYVKYDYDTRQIIITGLLPDISPENKIKVSDIEDAPKKSEATQRRRKSIGDSE